MFLPSGEPTSIQNFGLARKLVTPWFWVEHIFGMPRAKSTLSDITPKRWGKRPQAIGVLGQAKQTPLRYVHLDIPFFFQVKNAWKKNNRQHLGLFESLTHEKKQSGPRYVHLAPGGGGGAHRGHVRLYFGGRRRLRGDRRAPAEAVIAGRRGAGLPQQLVPFLPFFFGGRVPHTSIDYRKQLVFFLVGGGFP